MTEMHCKECGAFCIAAMCVARARLDRGSCWMPVGVLYVEGEETAQSRTSECGMTRRKSPVKPEESRVLCRPCENDDKYLDNRNLRRKEIVEN